MIDYLTFISWRTRKELFTVDLRTRLPRLVHIAYLEDFTILGVFGSLGRALDFASNRDGETFVQSFRML